MITRKRLVEFAAEHPDAMTALDRWYRLVRSARWSDFAELRADFPSADQVGPRTVFDIGGNKYRLIAAVHYRGRKIYVRQVLTHADYDRGDWKEG